MDKFLRRGEYMVAVFPTTPQPGSTLTITNDIIISRERGYEAGEVIQTKYYTAEEIIEMLKKEFGPTTDKAQLLIVSEPLDGGYVSASAELPIGTTVPVKALPTKWYKFIGWSNGMTSESFDVTLDGDLLLTAYFEELPNATIELIAEPEDKCYRLSGEGRFLIGESTTLTALPVAHWHFKNWSDGDTNKVRQYSVDSEGFIKLTAYFEEDPKYYVKVNIHGPGDILGDSEEYYRGDKVTLTAVPEFTYKFVGWNSEGTFIENPLTFDISSDITMNAYFKRDRNSYYAEMPNPEKWGLTNPIPYYYGGPIEFTYSMGDYFPPPSPYFTRTMRCYTADMDNPEHYESNPRFFFACPIHATTFNGKYYTRLEDIDTFLDVTYSDNKGRVIEHYLDYCTARPIGRLCEADMYDYYSWISPVLEPGLTIDFTFTFTFVDRREGY